MPKQKLDANSKIRKAVIPAAGFGTRFLPATRTVPKPLLPVLSTPTVEYAVREAVGVGVTEIALVLSPSGAQVSEYFAELPELVTHLERGAHNEEAREQREIASLAKISTIVQEEPLGLGHAVLVAEEWVGDEAFAVILPDDLIFGTESALSQLMGVRSKLGGQVIAAIETATHLLHTKGVISGNPTNEEDVVKVDGLVEKPAPGTAPSNLSIVGRYILEPTVFASLKKTSRGAVGEIQITDAITGASGQGIPTWASKLQGRHFDTGNPLGMLEAALFKAGGDTKMRERLVDLMREWGWQAQLYPQSTDD